jgi:hypothetical protein
MNRHKWQLTQSGLIPGIGLSEGETPSTESQRITGNLGGQKCSEVGSDLN